MVFTIEKSVTKVEGKAKLDKCSFLKGWLVKNMNLRILDELTKQLN